MSREDLKMKMRSSFAQLHILLNTKISCPISPHIENQWNPVGPSWLSLHKMLYVCFIGKKKKKRRDIFQTVFCVPQNTKSHTGLEQNGNSWQLFTVICGWTCTQFGLDVHTIQETTGMFKVSEIPLTDHEV